MAKGNRVAEVFGYPTANRSSEAQDARRRHWCPFVNKVCNKESRLIDDYPFGVCSVELSGRICTTCPRRFEEGGRIEGVPKVLEDITSHYFGDFNNVIPFAQVPLPQKIGRIDYVLVRHKPMRAEVDDFVAVEFQTDSTSRTGGIVRSLQDFIAGDDVAQRSYAFSMNTYDTIKRSMTQLFNKGIVYELWDTKCYWVMQEYIYGNLIKRYGLKQKGYSCKHASRFALYDLVLKDDRLTLSKPRFLSITVNELFRAMRNNPALPDKDKFIRTLNKELGKKLQARLSIKFE